MNNNELIIIIHCQ